MRIANGLVELLAAALFAYVGIVILMPILKSKRLSPLSAALVTIFLASVPHRLLHGVELLSGHPIVTSWLSLLVDGLVFGGLAWYAVARYEAHTDSVLGFTLVADQVGYQRLQGQVEALRKEFADAQAAARRMRQDLDLEHARMEVFTSNLRKMVSAMTDLTAHASEVAGGQPVDRRRMAKDADALAGPLTEFNKTLGLPPPADMP